MRPFGALPRAAAWLNLVEGFGKILTQRAPHGRTCRSEDGVAAALLAEVADWNAYPTSFLWGRPPRPTGRLERVYRYRL